MMLQAAAMTAPPADWSILPPLRLVRTPDYSSIMTRFVQDEVAAGRCAAPPPVDGRTGLHLDLIVLVAGSSGQAVRVIPRAINCPTVEQFAAGVIQKAARENIAGPPPDRDSWFLTSVTLTWPQ